MQEWGREEGPEDVDDEGQRGGEVEGEAVVFVGGHLRRGARDGLGGAVGAG